MIYKRSTVKCEDCPLSKMNRVWGVGNPNGKLVFVGEAPGQQEDLYGKPFVGEAGSMFNRMLKEAGIERDKVWITNYINCRPPNNNFYSSEAKKAKGRFCRSGLYEEIEWLCSFDKKVVIPLGNNACSAFQLPLNITRIRGNIYYEGDLVLIPTYHPSFICHNEGNKSYWENWKSDFVKAKEHSFSS